MAKLFGKKKYVSEDNLTKFSGMIQKVLLDMLNKFKIDIGKNIDDRFNVLTSKQQGDSEVIEAREGKISLLQNLKTFFKRSEHEEYTKVVDGKFSDQRKLIDNVFDEANKANGWIGDNKTLFESVVSFVEGFAVEKYISDNGYIKFPKIFGGFIFQYGKQNGLVIQDGDVCDAQITYPVAFNSKCFIFIPSIDTVDKNNFFASFYNCIGRVNGSTTNGWFYAKNLTNDKRGALMDISWIAIGI